MLIPKFKNPFNMLLYSSIAVASSHRQSTAIETGMPVEWDYDIGGWGGVMFAGCLVPHNKLKKKCVVLTTAQLHAPEPAQETTCG